MLRIQSISKICVLVFPFLVACSGQESIYQDLAPEEDGTIAIEIPEDGAEAPLREPVRAVNQLAQSEVNLVDQWHEGEYDKLSFVVVRAKTRQVVKSYYSDIPQRLASVSKVTTALAALENVRNVEVPKVARMLKNSNNGEASRYVRLAAKALEGLVTPTKHYTQKASCPSEFLNDKPAAEVAFEWLISEMQNVDWAEASFNDGAGCNYNNFMTPLQTAAIFEYADNKGAVYDGKDFEDLLSINGKDGTWKNKNKEHKGYIFAKTGTLNPNANLAGYFYAKQNGQFKKYYFAVFVNKKGGGSYSTRARKLIEGLMRYWINYYSANPDDPLGEL